jgi:hypothetical protein
LKIINEIEENERLFVESDSDLSSESESDDEYPKKCGRQDNVMPNGRLSETLEDINCELMKRVDSNASNFQPSPKTTRRLLSLSTENSKNHSRSSS